jgi:hypothetical protein
VEKDQKQKHWWHREWEEIRPHLKFHILMWIAGSGVILSGIVTIYRVVTNTQVQLTWVALLAIFIICTFGFAAISLYLRSLRDIAFKERLVRSTGYLKKAAMIYVPIILGIAFCVWGYYVASRVHSLNEDVRHLRTQATRYVLPRELTQQQTSSLADFLSRQKPQRVVFTVAKGDDEAGSYGGNLQTAFTKGGWPISNVDYADDLPGGLRVDVKQSAGAQAEPDLSNIIQQAFQAAQIELNGSSGGSDGSISPPVVTISVGHRRRDKWAVSPKRKYKRGEVRPPGYPSDDDY